MLNVFVERVQSDRVWSAIANNEISLVAFENFDYLLSGNRLKEKQQRN